MSHCTCDYHQEQNKKRQLGEECKHADPNSKVERRWTQEEMDELVECNICKPSEDKKEWEAEIPTTEQIVRLSRIALLKEILAEVENYPRKTYKTINEQCIQDGVVLEIAELIRKKMV